MRVKFWGTRGSIPTPMNTDELRAKIRQLLKSIRNVDLSTDESIDRFLDSKPIPDSMTFGGDTPCIEICEGDDIIIVDCGSGLRRLGRHMMTNGVDPGKRINIFITHTHWDHIMGFPFFAPALEVNTDIHIYGAHPNLRKRFEQQMDLVHFPITIDDMSAEFTFHQIEAGKPVTIGPFRIDTAALNHPGGSYSYRITAGGKSLVIATDGEYNNNGGDTLHSIEHYRDAALLIFDAMYPTLEETVTKEDYGHSTAVIGIDIALESNVKKLALFHHNPDSDDSLIADTYAKALDYLKSRKTAYPGSNLSLVTTYDGLELEA